MRITWNSRKITYTTLVILIGLWAYMSFHAASDAWNAREEFAEELSVELLNESDSRSQDMQARDEKSEQLTQPDTRLQAIRFSLFMVGGTLCIGLNVLVSVAYTFRERHWTRLRSGIVGLVLCAFAGIFYAAASAMFSYPSGMTIIYGIGIAVAAFIAFCILIGILAAVRKVMLTAIKNSA